MAKYKFDGVSFRDFSDLMAFLQAYVDVRGNKDSVDPQVVIKRLLEEQREGDAVFGNLTNNETLQRIERIAISVYGGIKNRGERRAEKDQILAGMSKRMGTLVEGFREHQKKQGTEESRRNLSLTKNWEFEDEVQDVEEDNDETNPPSEDPRSVADGKAKRARTSALKAYEKAAEAFSALTQQAEDFEEKLKEELGDSLEGTLEQDIAAIRRNIRSISGKISKAKKKGQEVSSETEEALAKAQARREKHAFVSARQKEAERADAKADKKYEEFIAANEEYKKYILNEVKIAQENGDEARLIDLQKKYSEAVSFPARKTKKGQLAKKNAESSENPQA